MPYRIGEKLEKTGEKWYNFRSVPEPLVEKIRTLDNRDQLEVLFGKVATSDTLEELHSAVDAFAEDENHLEHSEYK